MLDGETKDGNTSSRDNLNNMQSEITYNVISSIKMLIASNMNIQLFL